MKKYVALIVALALLAAVGAGAALAQEAELRALREGRYIVGEDIEAGAYTLTCTATAGEQMKDAYGSLGGAFDKLDGGGSEYGPLFGALGGLMEEVIDMTVEIIGDYGDVLKRYDMKAGDSIKITLKAKTALKITDGSCTLTALQ